uniref:DUF148 domain-containing protein n=1 Tax=Strongyloides papillosus TaxID=174720 RepID=A0A0N5B2G3_STREA
MSSINLFNCLTLLVVVQGVLSQVAFLKHRHPKYPHANYHLSQLKVRELSLKHQNKKLASDHEYLQKKLETMKGDLISKNETAKDIVAEGKQIIEKSEELKKKIKEHHVNVDKMIADIITEERDQPEVPALHKKGPKPKAPRNPKAGKVGQSASQKSKSPQKSKQTGSYK